MISFAAHAVDADLRRGLARRVQREWHDAGANVIFFACALRVRKLRPGLARLAQHRGMKR